MYVFRNSLRNKSFSRFMTFNADISFLTKLDVSSDYSLSEVDEISAFHCVALRHLIVYKNMPRLEKYIH